MKHILSFISFSLFFISCSSSPQLNNLERAPSSLYTNKNQKNLTLENLHQLSDNKYNNYSKKSRFGKPLLSYYLMKNSQFSNEYIPERIDGDYVLPHISSANSRVPSAMSVFYKNKEIEKFLKSKACSPGVRSVIYKTFNTFLFPNQQPGIEFNHLSCS